MRVMKKVQKYIKYHMFIPFDEKGIKTWMFATEGSQEVIGALFIARGKAFVIPVPSEGITAEEWLRLKWYNRKISQKSPVGFNMLIL